MVFKMEKKMKPKIYSYKNCGTCRKALKFLEQKKIDSEILAIRETPPSKKELKYMLFVVKDIKKLFNTSGQDYKSLGLKDKLASMSESEMLDLLSSNGNLVKRPFVLLEETALIGFKEEEWKKVFK